MAVTIIDSTPVWVPIAAAGIAVAGTISGVAVTQRWSDRRERLSRERERQHEQDRWRREDEARSFEHRRFAYAEFYEALRQMALRAYEHGMGLSDETELPFEWNDNTWRKLQTLMLYATPGVTEAATEAYTSAWRWGASTEHGKDDEDFYYRQDLYNERESELLDAIRRSLSIPGTD